MLRSALRDALTLVIRHKGRLLLVDTDIPIGVPPVVREHSRRAAAVIDARLQVHEQIQGALAKARLAPEYLA